MQNVKEAITAIREVLAEPEQKTCLVANESCKHGSWCSEAYCQEHCEFVAQPEQEPVAWAFLNWQYAHIVWGKQRPDDEIHTIPLYTTPQPAVPERKPLTDEEIRKAEHHKVDGAYDYSFKQGVRWAEHKHGITGESK